MISRFEFRKEENKEMKFSKIMMLSLLICTMLVGSFAGPFGNLIATVIAQQTVPRSETLILSGYDGSPNALRPWNIAGSAGMAFYFMYEPLFGVNIAKGSAPEDLVKIVGENITWLNSTTIEVKIRKEANWTDGTPITSEDVEYSYGVYGLFNFTEKPWIAQETLSLKERLQSWENVDNKTFRIHIKPEYPNSTVVWRHITLSYNILPKHVWTQIEAAYPNATRMLEFTNDWQDPNMNASWKVASGMYLPTYHTDTIAIMTRNDNWWGKAVFGKLPAPKYIQHTRYSSNAVAALDLQSNEIDICGNFIPGMAAIMSAFPQIHTYDPNPPYYAETSIKLLVPNHHNYPIDASWLHWAMAESLDYSAISAVSSGYLKAPYPYPSHLLPSDDAVAKALVKNTTELQYAIYNNLTAATEILNQYCIKVGNTWYTKDGPPLEWIQKYLDPAANLTIGDVTHPASYWNATYPASLNVTDKLSSEPGINLPLGPWTIMDQQGWSDVLAIDALACSQLKNLGITMTQKVADWGTNDEDGHSFNYNFMHYVMHTSTGTMFDRYYQMFVGTDHYWNHYGDYRNATLVDLLRQLDTTTGTAQQAVADQILAIIGTDMPIIPFGGHPNWYQYNSLYWVGFSNKATNQILPAGPFGGTSTSALLQSVVLGLTSSTSIEYSDIAISKANLVPGETTKISAHVTNTVNYAVSITAQLLINGNIFDSLDLSFAANESKTVSFNVSETGLGTYLVNLGGLTTTFVVAETVVIPAFIKGNVTDANTGEPISGATVVASPYQTTTATNGSYSLEVATGNYTLTISKTGYSTVTTTVLASVEGTTYTKNVTLAPVLAGEVVPMWVYAVIAVLVIVIIIALVYAFVIKKK
jgi:ABC-type transport system substrate-binding protein